MTSKNALDFGDYPDHVMLGQGYGYNHLSGGLHSLSASFSRVPCADDVAYSKLTQKVTDKTQ